MLNQAHSVIPSLATLVASLRGLTVMASNPIQFQPGKSLSEFLRYFGIEARCADSLARARWPAGLACPACSATAHCVVNRGNKTLDQCNTCRYQALITAGTLFASPKPPLSTWFLAIYLISLANQCSAVDCISD